MSRALFVGGPRDGDYELFPDDPPREIRAPDFRRRPRFEPAPPRGHVSPDISAVTYRLHRYEYRRHPGAAHRLVWVYLIADLDPGDRETVFLVEQRILREGQLPAT